MILNLMNSPSYARSAGPPQGSTPITASILSEPAYTVARPWPEAIVAALQRQESLLDRLDQLSRLQSALIAEGHVDRLLALLSQRQLFIDEFLACQAQTTMLSQELDGRLAVLPADVRDRIRGLTSRIAGQLRDLMRRDQEDQAVLQAARTAAVAVTLSSDTTAQRERPTTADPLVPVLASFRQPGSLRHHVPA